MLQLLLYHMLLLLVLLLLLLLLLGTTGSPCNNLEGAGLFQPDRSLVINCHHSTRRSL